MPVNFSMRRSDLGYSLVIASEERVFGMCCALTKTAWLARMVDMAASGSIEPWMLRVAIAWASGQTKYGDQLTCTLENDQVTLSLEGAHV